MNRPGKEKRILVATTEDSIFGTRLLSGIGAFAQHCNSWTIRLATDDSDISQMANQMQPDGVILSRLTRVANVESLLRSGIPCVLAATGIEYAGTHPVFFFDDQAIGRLGADHLLETRAVSYAFVGYQDANFSRERQRGFSERLANRRMRPAVHEFRSIDSMHFGLNPVRFGPLEDAFATWLGNLPRPVAVMAADDKLANLITLFSRQLELRIPEELAILGVDNASRYCHTTFPVLSSVRVPVENMGWEAARTLDEWLGGAAPAAGVRRLSNIEVVKRQSTGLSRVEDALVSKAIRYIEKRIEQSFSVGEIEQELGVSRRALELRFRRSIGRTPLMEIRRQRVEHAKKLLLQTDDSVGRIAKHSGFNSTTRFCIVFKEFTDLRPSEYRASLNPAKREELAGILSERADVPRQFLDQDCITDPELSDAELTKIISIEKFVPLGKRMAKFG